MVMLYTILKQFPHIDFAIYYKLPVELFNTYTNVYIINKYSRYSSRYFLRGIHKRLSAHFNLVLKI